MAVPAFQVAVSASEGGKLVGDGIGAGGSQSLNRDLVRNILVRHGAAPLFRKAQRSMASSSNFRKFDVTIAAASIIQKNSISILYSVARGSFPDASTP
jgi:hypothetical protein